MPSDMSSMSPSAKQHQWHILGAGAIGSLWAHWLNERALLIVKDSIDTRSKRSLIIETIFAEKQTREHSNITCIHASQLEKAVPCLLICTKAHHTLGAIQNLNIHPQATIVLLQNGLGVYELLQKTFPQAQIFSATTTHGAYRKNPAHIVHAGKGSTWLGSLDNRISELQINNCVEDLNNEHETIIPDYHVENRLWKKLAINCAINPLTMIYQCQNGELLHNAQYHLALEKVCRELDLVLRAKKIISANESMLKTIEDVAEQTANNFSSMLQDRQHKRHSEIDFIQGYLCGQADNMAISVPENQNLLATIKKIEAQY